MTKFKYAISNFFVDLRKRIIGQVSCHPAFKKYVTIVSPIAIAFCITLYALIGATLVTAGCTKTTLDSSLLQEGIATELLRFHVIANSDSSEDQAVKLKVKEAVVSYLKPYLSNVNDKSAAMKIITEQLGGITAVADHILEQNGFSYTANSELSTSTFPVKIYGDITLPPGEYDALRVELGKAEGQNWWCIMFPQLCFVDVTYNVVPEKSKQQLKHVLTEDEYEAILSKDDVDVKVKFKLFDWLKDLFD